MTSSAPAASGRRWTAPEIEVLHTVYIEQGLEAALAQLPDRSRQSTYVKVNRLGLQTKHRPVRQGFYRKAAARALHLRLQGMSYRAIGVELGMCEAAATNAVLVGECTAAGHRPLERGADGRIAMAGRERIRLMLRKGMRHRDIQVRCGIAAATITRERRLYENELKERRLAPLPPPGGGERYSGARIPKATTKEVERLYLEGFGAAKVSERTGVSRTHVLRIRAKLIKRLARKGECLAGCDFTGRRTKMKDHLRSIPTGTIEKLRTLLLQGMSVRSAAHECVLGLSTAYKEFHRLKDELNARGESMPRHNWRYGAKRDRARSTVRLPGGRWAVDRYRELLRSMSAENARAQVLEEYRAAHQAELAQQRLEDARKVAAARRPRSFAEQLAAVASGKARVIAAFRPQPTAYDMTLGGVGSSML